MNVFGRGAVLLLESIGQGLWGFKPNLMRHLVEQHGPGDSLLWFARNMPTYERTLTQWGAIRTHLLTAEISVLNGCPYCTYGHAYALQLHYFRDTGRLIPADENEIVAWHELSDVQIIERFRGMIDAAGLSSEHPYLEQMLVLRRGSEQSLSPDDHKIQHLIEMFSFLNRCGIRGKAVSDQAHDPINKDTALQNEYHRRRHETTMGYASEASSSCEGKSLQR